MTEIERKYYEKLKSNRNDYNFRQLFFIDENDTIQPKEGVWFRLIGDIPMFESTSQRRIDLERSTINEIDNHPLNQIRSVKTGEQILNEIWASTPFGDPNSPFFKDRKKKKEKKLEIQFYSCSEDTDNYNFRFIITNKDLDSRRANFFIDEINNILPNTTICSKTLNLGSMERTTFDTKASKKEIKKLNPNFEFDGFEFKAFLLCDGLSAETNKFVLGSKKTESNKTKQQECLCKKREYSAADIKNIVTELRKLDTRQISWNPKDKNGNRTYKDLDGKIVPSTDRGVSPNPKFKLNLITIEQSVFDDIAEDGKKNKDRLFLKKSNDFNVRVNEANYNELAKQINNTLKKYDINTCVRRIHFFAQLYHETQKLTTTYEADPSSSVSGGDYYRGRGLVHLTHDYNYLHYYDYRFNKSFFKSYLAHRVGYESVNQFNIRTENKYISVDEMKKVNEFIKLVSTELFYACDTAGWYWKEYKINTFADKDYLINVSAIINNPSAKNVTSTTNIRGYSERRKYYDLMKIIFDYENCK